jgi:hypothetical protein
MTLSEVLTMNRNRFKSDMEAAWELRPGTDETPSSGAHSNRFGANPLRKLENAKKMPAEEKNRENGS